MGLTVPEVSVTPGPTYASEVNLSLSVIDQHTHSPGSGVQITPSGLNINSDLPFQNNNATGLRTSRYTPQGAPITGSSSQDVGCVYVAGVDLYYNDGSGNQIRMTQSGGVAGATGSIAGLTAPASATYVSVSNTFVWQSDVNTAANLDARNLILRNSAASSFGLTLQPPAAMSGNLALTLPGLPGATSFVTLDSSGNFNGNVPIAGGITRPMQASVGQVLSSSSFLFQVTNAQADVISLSITTTGRPVMLMFQSPSTLIGAAIIRTFAGAAGMTITRDGTDIAFSSVACSGTQSQLSVPIGCLNMIDIPSSGTHTYVLKASAGISATTSVFHSQMVAYEL
jgi:hypothetical protein